MSKQAATIRIREANEHNLKGISLEIPHKQFVVVTGVSGSGKSSLIFDVVAREGQRRYLENFPSFSRQFMGKLARPDVAYIEGLSPVITLGQKTTGGSVRSTVGTMSDLYDLLRLLYARLGQSELPIAINRSLFSFNGAGACPTCRGLGLEEKISKTKVVADSTKTLREGALAPTLPNGYIMYSQVTVDVLNQVCKAHGFHVDIAWNALTEEQQNVIWKGSERLKVPFGKHSLESRLKWTGITAKPREEGFYKGMIPIMSDILRRDRNKNILRYAESLTCTTCGGSRLSEEARSVKLAGKTIAELAALELHELRTWLQQQTWKEAEAKVADAVARKMIKRIDLLERLGVEYLSLDRPSNTLSGGESQRIRLMNQVCADLSDVLYVFDEPSAGLHPTDNAELLKVLRLLVQGGNSLLVVEHDEATIQEADWIVDIGPAAGVNGGTVLFNGPMQQFLQAKKLAGKSPTYDLMTATPKQPTASPAQATVFLDLPPCSVNNLKNTAPKIQLRSINVVTGVSGAGKSSLLHGGIKPFVQAQLDQKADSAFTFDQLVAINRAPIGRTPRSNPATYTGLADHIRDLFAKQPAAKAAGFTKSRFSFNTKGGRCETCEGAGAIQIGMHFLGSVQVTCGTCAGQRFHPDTLSIRYRKKHIAEVLDLSVSEAADLFREEPKLLRSLQTLEKLGLGYLKLGQPSSTLSGGEAQRIKLATHLQQKDTGNTLYLLDEPTAGLHGKDVAVLLHALDGLRALGNTVVCIEHDLQVIRHSDWIIDLGPGRGAAGGNLVVQGTVAAVMTEPRSLTGKALRDEEAQLPSKSNRPTISTEISLEGVRTHNLKNISLSIPKQQLTVITGVSGSGKSSLAFHTLFAEGQSRFVESFSTYARSQLRQSNPSELDAIRGLGPVVAIGRKYLSRTPRSTAGTLTGLYDHFRLLYSRLAQQKGLSYTAQHFSFNHQLGACPTCDGLGIELTCDPNVLIAHPEQSILDGAIGPNKVAQHYGDPHGRYLALLAEVNRTLNLGLDRPWNEVEPEAQQIALFGTGDRRWKVLWKFKNKTREGEQEIEAPWLGFNNYVDEEYQRKHQNKNIQNLLDLMRERPCSQCQGSRLKPELAAIQLGGKSISELTQLSVANCLGFLEQQHEHGHAADAIVQLISNRVVPQLEVIQELGLDYLNLDRRANTLSGGEGQRLRLAGQLASNLYGVTYVLDEPTIGLHASNISKLLGVIQRIIGAGNTVVVVEHEAQVIRHADHIIELGPASGKAGGSVTFEGDLNALQSSPSSVTAPYLKGEQQASSIPRTPGKQPILIQGAHANNLKNIDLQLPTAGLVAITGLSGSGKSSLMREVIYASAQQGQAVGCQSIAGLEQFDRVRWLSQDAWSGHSLSTPATFLGLMDKIRDCFAKTEEARKSGLKKGAFSYLSAAGKCPTCGGMGQVKTSLDFMSDLWSTCLTCEGSRYQASSNAVLLHGYSIGDVLQMSTSEALVALASEASVLPYLQTLEELGLGHLQLGQAANTLSGGEAQRLKLASELIQGGKGSCLFLFDEPTTGLHFKDVEQLATVFNALADRGHSVFFVEHNAQLIAQANHLIELGVGGGEEGGAITANKGFWTTA